MEIKEVFKHIIDCERVFAYRALRFSRNDITELSSFDENSYAENSTVKNQSLLDLGNEYKYVRKSTIYLFQNMTEEILNYKVIANNIKFSKLSLDFVIIGHNLHHINVIKSKYLL